MLGLGGGMTALFILVTSSFARKKASVLLSVALSGFLATGGAIAMHLLHAVTGSGWLTPDPLPLPTANSERPAVVSSEPAPEPAPAPEPGADPQDVLASAADPAEAEPTPPEAAPEPEPEPAPAPASQPASSGSSGGDDELFASMAAASEPAPAPEPEAKPPPKPAPAPAPAPAPEPASTASTVLLPSVIDTMLKNNSGVVSCLQLEYKRAGTLPAQLPIGFEVQSSGKVSSMWVKSSEYRGSQLESCLRSAVYKIQFPPFEGEPAKMKYTFRIK